MSLKLLTLILLCVNSIHYCFAQRDSSVIHLQDLPKKYLTVIDQKTSTYTKRITNKTEKTLVKLARWEEKVQRSLTRVNPEAAAKLFDPGHPTFTTLLQKYKEGEAIGNGYKASYDPYRDQLTTQLAYLQEKKELLDQKYFAPLKESRQTVQAMDSAVQQTEAVQLFIKERKKQLMQEALKHLGKSKYLQKINKESFYYTETLRNYEKIFSDPSKAEATAMTLLNKVPLFQKFMRDNSMLASLFRVPGNYGPAQSLAGLQTRASVNTLIQGRIAAGGPNAMAEVQSNLQQAQTELTKLKDKILHSATGNSDAELPDFKPNMQKTKTFAQRIEYGLDLQSVKSNSFMPGAVNLGLSIAYKINDKSLAGFGISYRLGLGAIDKIRFSHEGVGLRSFMDWKLKKQFFVSGGFEMNHHASFKTIAALQQADAWQQSGLVGISKKVTVKSKLMKGTKLQLMYDLLHSQHNPVSQAWVFRMGYSLK